MEFIAGIARPAHGNGARQARIRTEHPTALAALRVGIEVDDLAARMHAGVGATRAGDFDRGVGDEAQRRLDRRLNRVPMGQALPAEKIGAVVFDAERDAQCGASFGAKREW